VGTDAGSVNMVARGDAWSIQGDIHTAWQGALSAIRQMRPSCSVRPTSAPDIFKVDGDSALPKFNIGPVVFNVPERANYLVSNLYVVVRGWIVFGAPLAAGAPRITMQFGTQVGYFRMKNNQLSHVYGIHYDMDERLPGHPVFHAQLATQVKLAPAVMDNFRIPVDPNFDWSAGLLRTVRTPTAQMDAFSVITQIGADHLLGESASQENLKGFARLRAACDFFLGAGARLDYLNSLPASHCYRSTHWYARPNPIDE
jgi:hypothetical protein